MLHTKFQGHRSIGSGEEDLLRFLPYMGMVAMLVTMLHTKFHCHWSIGSGEDFLRFLPYMGMAAMLVM